MRSASIPLSVAESRYDLGYLYLVLGEIEEARSSFEACLAIWDGPGDLSDRAATLHALGRVAESEGKIDEAMAQANESLQLRMKDTHPDLLDITELKITMARLHRKRKESDEAEKLYREALADLRDNGQAVSPMSSTILTNLAVVMWQRGRLEEAESLHRESLAQRRRFYPRGAFGNRQVAAWSWIGAAQDGQEPRCGAAPAGSDRSLPVPFRARTIQSSPMLRTCMARFCSNWANTRPLAIPTSDR